MKVVRTVAELQDITRQAKAEGKTVGLVPTMGALHAGHKSLIDRARKENDAVVVSVFVNPTQFNNPDDLRTYPRTEEADCALLEKAGVDYAFIPSVSEVYPEKDERVFDLGPVAEVMEGARRPGHFNGVAQIVSRLFEWAQPTRAYFGEKDFQQIAVIRRMAQVSGFDDIDIVACPIVREADGLALSSRNVRLTPEMRAAAPNIHRILADSLEYARTHTVAETEKHVEEQINAVPGLQTEYYTISDTLTMQPLSRWPESGKAVGCVTVYAGDVRLIDNITY
ncbi:MAG: pantoate--beta-alanine ligase [Muribaculaceae bacterium]|nr:pantoate--beta-alanine ligase [Bacteroidales bacterium]MDD6722465.1 pantoate--beta-alanine ligase [Bacteroidales bacterium]